MLSLLRFSDSEIRLSAEPYIRIEPPRRNAALHD
ncbi:Hypothetical protein PFCIRM129_11995 [Propionibacterium freudenreichii subsp. freudenreichii]|nr:Hypothetical protein PFCIRM129_11995 [Propionibacterium freudenreichii subsp. freudenreichii]